MDEHELWPGIKSIITIILISIVFIGLILIGSSTSKINDIKKNWDKYRCSPTYMPFAAFFGHNTAENFHFCMGKTFQTHAEPYFGSFGGMMGDFTGLLTSIFGSIGSLRNTIASLGGGINVIFQEFTERISMFFFNLRISAVRIKMLIGRMYAILFSVMYMGMSGITGMTTFTNTFLFSFLDTFCFPGNTKLHVKDKGQVEIKDIQMGDVLLPTKSKVTGLFRFYSKGQPMVLLNDIIVSTNHYVVYNGRYIKAGKHPNAKDIGVWDKDEPLYCLDTENNQIPIKGMIFLDYDETQTADKETMKMIEHRLNATNATSASAINISDEQDKFLEYCPGIDEDIEIKIKRNNTIILEKAKNIQIGDELSMGGKVIGLIRRNATEYCETKEGIITPSTLYWDAQQNKWRRIGQIYEVQQGNKIVVSFIVISNSQLELSSGLVIRDYMELCSPDSEMYYSKCLE